MRGPARSGLILAAALGACGGGRAPDRAAAKARDGGAATATAAAPARGPAAAALIEALGRGELSAVVARFDARLRQALPSERLAAAWEDVVASSGALRRARAGREAAVGAWRVVEVACEHERGARTAKVSFEQDGRVAGLFFLGSDVYRPPPDVPPDALEERAVTIASPAASLPGTLTLPRGRRARAAVLLVHGSGPHDRNEAVGPNRPFQDLAWGLARRGVAALRYDKRTRVAGKAMAADPRGFTIDDETVDDAVAALALLRATPELAGARLYVVGHSLGGMLAPRIGARAPSAAGLALLAAPSRPIEEVILDQARALHPAVGPGAAGAREELARIEAEVGRVRAGELAPTGPAILGAPPRYWLELRGYRQTEVARRLRRPLLVLQGGRDFQVGEVDLEGWRKALAGRRDVTFRRYPSLNHLFMAGEGPSTPSEYQRPRHVAPEVLDDLAAWIEATGPRR